MNTPKLTLTALLVACATVTAAPPIGTKIEKVVNVLQRKTINPNEIKNVIALDLPEGLWRVDGSLSFFFYGDQGEVIYLATGIERSVTLAYFDPWTIIDSTVIHQNRADKAVQAIGRYINICGVPNGTRRVYLNAWFYPNASYEASQVYGTFTAFKVAEMTD